MIVGKYMIKTLANFLISKNKFDTRTNYGIACGIIGIFFNILLFLIKLSLGTIMNSLAITADGFNNLSDSGSSIITIVSFVFSSKKADEDHPYGHGRYEYISGLIISFGVLLIALQFLIEAIKKIIDPQTINYSLSYVFILVIAICIKLYMAYYNLTTAKKIHSLTIKASGIDSIADALTTLVILISLLIYHYININIDGYASLLVSLLILKTAYQTSKDTINHLVGKAPDRSLIKKIEMIVKDHPLIIDMHDLMIHDYGFDNLIATLHVEVDANNDLLTIHDQINTIEEKIKNELNCQITIHIDPIVIDDQRLNDLRVIIQDYLNDLSIKLSYHDLRIIKKDNIEIVYFDVIVPYTCEINENMIINELDEQIIKYDPNLKVDIKIDHC